MEIEHYDTQIEKKNHHVIMNPDENDHILWL